MALSEFLLYLACEIDMPMVLFREMLNRRPKMDLGSQDRLFRENVC